MPGAASWLTLLAATVAAFIVANAGAGARYDPGASDTEITIGHTCPYSGPASSYGTVGRAIAAYFKKINDDGGINGRKITFISYDDSYSPPKTVEVVRRLVEQDKVLLLFQTLGTPTNTAIWEYVNRQKIPHLFISTGASKFADPQGHPWTMPFNATYDSEARVYAKYIRAELPDARIAVLYQNDDFGKDYVRGLQEGLGPQAERMIVATQTYEVTDPTVDSQMVNLKTSGADVLFIVAIPKFAAQAIRKTSDLGWRPIRLLANVAGSISATLKPAGLEASKGLITANPGAKDPDDPQWRDDPGLKEWLAWMKKYYPDGDIHDGANGYAYSAAQTLVYVLRRAGDDLTRANILRQATSIKDLELPLALPGVRINTGPTDYRPFKQFVLFRFDGARWVKFGDVYDARIAHP